MSVTYILCAGFTLHVNPHNQQQHVAFSRSWLHGCTNFRQIMAVPCQQGHTHDCLLRSSSILTLMKMMKCLKQVLRCASSPKLHTCLKWLW